MAYPYPVFDNVVFSNTTNLIINSLSIVITDGTATTLTINANTVSLAGNSTGTNSSFIVNATAMYIGNTTNFGSANGIMDIFAANATTQIWANTAGVYAGNQAVGNAALTSLGLTFTGNSTGINSTAVMNATSISIGANTTGNTIITEVSVSVGLANVVVNTAGVFVANSTGVVNSAVFSVGATFTANSTVVNCGTNTMLHSGACTIAANGYSWLTNGLLMQWGIANANSTTGHITFPVAFPTTCFTCVGMMANSQITITNNMVFIVNSNTTTFGITGGNTTAPAGNVLVRWIAMGN